MGDNPIDIKLGFLEKEISNLNDKISLLQRENDDLKIQNARIQSHLESERISGSRHVESMNKKIDRINHKIYGNGEKDTSFVVKIDRLEKSEERRASREKVFITAASASVIAIVIDVFFRVYSMVNK